MPSSILLDAKKLDQITYSAKPLPQLKESDSLSYLSVSEFEQKFKIQYTESLHGDLNEILPILENHQLLASLAAGRPDTPTETAIIERMNNPLDCFVVCNMGPEVGYGLFTSKAIEENTVLFLYAGELAEPVAYSPEREADYAWLPQQSHGPIKTINAACCGGLARFMQHLPIDFEKRKALLEAALEKIIAENPHYQQMMQLRNITVSSYVQDLLKDSKKDDEVGGLHFHEKADKAKLMTSNVKLCTVVVSGIPIVIAMAEQNIPQNSQLGFSYGKQYWLTAKKQPRYFNEDGLLISESLYRNAFYSELNHHRPLLSGIIQPPQQTARQLYDHAVELYKAENKKEHKDYSRAIHVMTQAIQAYQQQDKKAELATCLDTIASLYREAGNIGEAIANCQTALTIREELVVSNAGIQPSLEKTRKKLQDLTQTQQTNHSKLTI